MPKSQIALAPITVLNWLVACGGFSVAVIGAGELFVPTKKPINYVTSALGLAFGLSVLIYLGQTLGLGRVLPALLYVYYPLMLLTGSLLFFFFTLLIEPDFPLVSPYLLLFLAPLIVALLMMPFFLQAPEAKIEQVPLYRTDVPFFRAAYYLIARNLETWVIGCMALFLARTAVGLARKRISWKPTSWGVIIFAVLVLAALMCYLWVNFFPSELSRKASILASILVTYPLYFFKQRNIALFGLRAAEGELGQSRRTTKLAGLDTDNVMERLDRAMRGKRLYSDASLSLSRLSAELGISPHQTSEILNARLGVNFRQYINRFRIEEAKSRLLASPERTMLEIAFDCGFGSKSAFNTAFSEATGMSPRDWRRGRTEKDRKKRTGI